MFEFIPIQYYSYIYDNIILLFIVFTLFHTIRYTGFTSQTEYYNKILGIILFLFVLFYMGMRPVSWYFGDMTTYAKHFDDIVKFGESKLNKGDIVFYSIMEFLALIESKTLFFFTITLLYISTLYFACKRLFSKYHFFAFLILVGSFQFWTFGTNGIRNGLATSVVLLAFTYFDKKWFMYLLFLIAFNIHSSVLIPITAYFVVYYLKSEKLYYKVWIASILLSLFIGNSVENFITNIGIMNDDVVNSYFKNKDLYTASFASTGFRWDFLLYSSAAVFVSYYFIFIKEFKDPYYIMLSNIYLLSNSVWILVIQASFSNRFAYLSWFMMGIIIIYPFLKQVFFNNQFKIIGLVILGYFSFTYLMNFILPNI